MRIEPRTWAAAARLAAALLGSGALAARASIWESTGWALTGTARASAGYDSNLTLSHDGPADFFVQARPQLTLLRRNSETDFHLDAVVAGTEFLRGRQPFQTDVYLTADYAYPLREGRDPLYRSSLAWQRSSEPDPYLGHRVRHHRFLASGEGALSLTGKLGLRAEAEAQVDNFFEPTLNHNQRWRGFTGVTYTARPGLEGSLNVGYAHGRSNPNNSAGGRSPVRSDEYSLTARARGTLTAKLTGTAYFGYGQVRYRGGYRNRHNLPIAGADLTWGIDPRRTVVLAAYRGADYAPDGQAVTTTRAFLSFTHVVVGHWQYILRGGPARREFRRETRQSTDRNWETGLDFAYVPSEVFRIGAGLTYNHQNSDVLDRRFNRSRVSVESSYRF